MSKISELINSPLYTQQNITRKAQVHEQTVTEQPGLDSQFQLRQGDGQKRNMKSSVEPEATGTQNTRRAIPSKGWPNLPLLALSW